MENQIMSTENSRFDARMNKELKDMLEKASQIGGYRSLTDFVLSTAQNKAKEIINEHDRILASQRDSEIFFNAILNLVEPNNKLSQAAKDFNEALSK